MILRFYFAENSSGYGLFSSKYWLSHGVSNPGQSKFHIDDRTTIENWAKICKYWHFDNILGVDSEIWPKFSSKCEHFANVLRKFRNISKIWAIFCECFAKYEQNLSEVLRNFSILSKYWARGRISPEIIIGIWVLSGEISKRDMGLLKRNIGYGQCTLHSIGEMAHRRHRLPFN